MLWSGCVKMNLFVREDKLVTPIRAGADLTHKQEQVLLYGMGVRPRRRFQSVEAMARELYKA